jgi:hypothetical protein
MLSEYELERLANIEANQQVLSELGLAPLCAVPTEKSKRPRKPAEIPPPREPSKRVKKEVTDPLLSMLNESKESLNTETSEESIQATKWLIEELEEVIEDPTSPSSESTLKADLDFDGEDNDSDKDNDSDEDNVTTYSKPVAHPFMPLPEIKNILMADSEDDMPNKTRKKNEKTLPSCPVGCPAGIKNCGGRGKKWFKQELRDVYKYQCLSCGIEFTNIPGASIDTAALCASSPITFQGLPQMNTKAKVQICKKCKKPRKGHICGIDAIFSMPIPVPPLSPLP